VLHISNRTKQLTKKIDGFAEGLVKGLLKIGRDGGRAQACPPSRSYFVMSRQQPVKEMKSPSGFGILGVKGSKANERLTSKPAFPAALMSTNGVSAVKA
jgi:hypothetical protein